MSNINVESKSQLAQLLAQEGIVVIHDKNLETAAFDPVKRKLFLPVLKKMTGDVYDLFVLHEVGHALYTPPKGFHDTPSEHGARYKGFLNVVEDARIEKKMKRKYPGGRSPMIRGYHGLMKQDFFGVNGMDCNKLSMIDRFNLYFKCGLALDIKFSEDESEFIDRGHNLESWDDVLDLVEDLWEYAAQEQIDEETLKDMMALPIDFDIDPFDEDDDDDVEYEQSEGSSNEEEMEANVKQSNDGEKDKGEEEDDETPVMGQEGGSFINDSYEIPEPGQISITDQMFRDKENELVRTDLNGDVHYINIPTFPYTDYIAKDTVVFEDHIKRIEETFDHWEQTGQQARYVSWCQERGDESWTKYQEWEQQNKPIINYMVKEFEMRKQARLNKRARIAQTGLIDTNNLYKYRIDDRIFKQVTSVPEGKNHGLIFYIDFSGSMGNIIGNVIQQAVTMALFCRQLKIPYRIYGFTNGNSHKIAKIMDENGVGNRQTIRENQKEKYQREGDIDMDHSLCLFEMFTDKQTSANFKRMARAMIEFPKYGHVPIPLSGTPLNDAIMMGIDLCNDFRREYGLDIVNTIFMTDGDSHGCSSYMVEENNNMVPKYFHTSKDIIFVKHKKTNTQVEVGRESGRNSGVMTDALVKLYRKATSSQVIGINIVNRIDGFVARKAGLNYFEMKEDIRKNGFLVSETDAYDQFFTVMDKTLRMSNKQEQNFGAIEAQQDYSRSKLGTAFKRMNRDRLKQRFMLGQFVEMVAEKRL